MGGILGKILANFMSKPEMRIIMVGLDAAGKVSTSQTCWGPKSNSGCEIEVCTVFNHYFTDVLLLHSIVIP